jgi:hypothetical protein
MKWVLLLFLWNEAPLHHSSYHDEKQCLFVGMHLQETNAVVRKFECNKVKEI